MNDKPWRARPHAGRDLKSKLKSFHKTKRDRHRQKIAERYGLLIPEDMEEANTRVMAAATTQIEKTTAERDQAIAVSQETTRKINDLRRLVASQQALMRHIFLLLEIPEVDLTNEVGRKVALESLRLKLASKATPGARRHHGGLFFRFVRDPKGGKPTTELIEPGPIKPPKPPISEGPPLRKFQPLRLRTRIDASARAQAINKLSLSNSDLRAVYAATQAAFRAVKGADPRSTRERCELNNAMLALHAEIKARGLGSGIRSSLEGKLPV